MLDVSVKDTAQASWSEAPAHPWHRFFARMVDMIIGGAFVMAPVQHIVTLSSPRVIEGFISLHENVLGRALFFMIYAFSTTFINAILISETGRSLGRYLLGIRVVDRNGNRIGFKRALRREFIVWRKGLGFGIPLICFFPMYRSFKALRQNGATQWDKDLGLKVEYKRPSKAQNVLKAIGILLSISFLTTLVLG